MIKINGARPVTTPSQATVFNNSDDANQCKVMERKLVKKNTFTNPVFSVSSLSLKRVST